MAKPNFYDTVNDLARQGIDRGILQLTCEDTELSDNVIRLSNRPTVNFGSCSYLGLEFDERLKKGAIRAIEQYGTQFSAARIYVSSKHYFELESFTDQIFGAHTLVAPTTTLGHIATIPVLMQDDDALILDHQAHNSMQTAISIIKHRGVYTEMIRHNNMNMLEEKVKELRQKFRRIWYVADGIYSMYGDAAPVEEIYSLMDKYPELHFYVDDAHGMSCFGKNGCGYVLSKKPMHEKMILATSLNKAFASGGSALVFPNGEWKAKVRNTGGPFLSSGPMQPGSLGAALASAKIHLSEDIYSLQEELHENIKYTNLALKKYGMPSVSENDSPVFFVGVSLPKMAFTMIQRLMNDGFYTNIGVFPTVPIKNSGVRFTITRLHTFEQIENMVAAMAYHYPLALEECEFTMDKVYRAFKMNPPEEKKAEEKVISLINQSLKLTVEHCDNIQKINKEEWDLLLGDRGSFNWKGLQLLEQSFKENELQEDNWEFDYFIIRDLTGKPVLATFLTTALCKDDMLSTAEISAQAEAKRISDKYFSCTKTILVGSLLTEGEHLYLDKSSPYWKDALKLLFEKVAILQDKYHAGAVNFRDFDKEDEELTSFFAENGYFKISMPENNVVENMEWNTMEEYIGQFSSRTRRHLRQEVIKNVDKFTVEVIQNPSKETVNEYYQLYLNVKNKSLELNTFTLPYKFFEKLAASPDWECIELKLKKEYDITLEQKPVAVVLCNKGINSYNPILVGLDYQCPREFNAYRQAIFQVILRAKSLGMKSVRLGYSASVEKRKFGARVFTPSAYVQLKDNYNMEALSMLSSLKKPIT